MRHSPARDTELSITATPKKGSTGRAEHPTSVLSEPCDSMGCSFPHSQARLTLPDTVKRTERCGQETWVSVQAWWLTGGWISHKPRTTLKVKTVSGIHIVKRLNEGPIHQEGLAMALESPWKHICRFVYEDASRKD